MPDLSTAGAPNVPGWKLVADTSVTQKTDISVSVGDFSRYRVLRDPEQSGMNRLRWNGISSGYSSITQGGNSSFSQSEVEISNPYKVPVIDIIESDTSAYYRLKPHDYFAGRVVAGSGSGAPISSIRLFDSQSLNRDEGIKVYGIEQ